MKKIYVVILSIIIILISTGRLVYASSNDIETAEVKVIDLIPNSNNTEENNISNKVKVKIISGKHKGEVLIVDNLINDKDNDRNSIESYNVHKGDELFLEFEEDNSGKIINPYIYDFVRYKYLAVVAFIFIALLIVIGGKKGIKSLLTLLLTVFAIIKVLIPIILKGVNPELPTIFICIILLTINFLIVSGFNKKSLGAILGTTLGLSTSGILLFISGNMLRVTGINDEDAQTLTAIGMGNTINFKGIFFTCVMLGCLGAIMDIGITISSAMYEMKRNNPSISDKELIRSGMNVGKDIMGTMSNTLILAYTGSSMILLLILISNNMSFIEIINQDIVTSEVLKALIGGISIILTIPCTVFISAKLKITGN
jgi:uncharacterized membrane protein